ncbi:unnamed protein product, partial [Musa acuminata subsp. burmannicoides]
FSTPSISGDCQEDEEEPLFAFAKSRVSLASPSMASTNPLAPKADQESEGSFQNTADMTAFVQNLLVQMQTRFQAMSEGILFPFNCDTLDEMGSRIDELEKSINDLKAEMEVDSPIKPNPEEDKPSNESS